MQTYNAETLQRLANGAYLVKYTGKALPTLVRIVSAKYVCNTVKLQCTQVRETEKAVLVDATVDTACGRKGQNIWLPKSQIGARKGNWLEVATWMLGKKEEELPSGYYCYITA